MEWVFLLLGWLKRGALLVRERVDEATDVGVECKAAAHLQLAQRNDVDAGRGLPSPP